MKYLLPVYFSIRFFSYFFRPEGLVNTLASLAFLVFTSYLLIKKNNKAWFLIAGEIILGGAGGFLSIGQLSLRTCLLFASITIYGIQNIKNLKKIYFGNKIPVILIACLWIITLFSAINGYRYGHDLKLIYSDAIPYLFLFYYFPLRDLWSNKKFRLFSFKALLSAVVGNFVLIMFTFTGFSSGLFALQDNYYKWYRDVALGKITELGFNFYRVVIDEHLLLTPILLYFLQQSINKTKKYLPYLFLLTIILSVNLTRIYILALGICILFLFNVKRQKKWLCYSSATVLLLIVSFTCLHLLTSRGQSLGWELFGLRLQSIAAPSLEKSSLSRMLLLEPIWQTIRTRPVLGSGLGATVKVYSPVLEKEITTPQFDWGYLEIWAESGLAGLLVWITLLLYILKTNRANDPFIITLAIINLTSPALFHVLGIVFLSFIFILNKKTYSS